MPGMRIFVAGAGGFVGTHLDTELARVRHVRVARQQLVRGGEPRIHAALLLSTDGVRGALDLAINAGARRVVFLSSIGAAADSPRPQLAARGWAEQLVRACGIDWVILRPEILWGAGDVFTNELAHLLRHLPFVPVPRAAPVLEPIHVADVARALLELIAPEQPVGREWTLVGPEPLGYAEIVDRIAEAIGLRGRRRLGVAAWTVRLGASMEERIAHRPRETRALLDRLVAAGAAHAASTRHGLDVPRRRMTVEALRAYLTTRSPAEQLAAAAPARATR